MLASKLTAMLSPRTLVLVSSPAPVIKTPWQRQLKVILVDSSRTHSVHFGEEAGNSAATGSGPGWAQQHSAEERKMISEVEHGTENTRTRQKTAKPIEQRLGALTVMGATLCPWTCGLKTVQRKWLKYLKSGTRENPTGFRS